MRILIGVAVAFMFGCAAPWEEPSQGGTAQASGSLSGETNALPTCPDPPDCTHPNGTGVYFEEGGLAAMDPFELMIMHFINTGSSVDVVGRYHDNDTGIWKLTKGKVEGVLTAGGLVPVGAMGATATIPTWKVAAPSPPGGFVNLTDLNLIGLRLALSFPIKSNARFNYAFWLTARSVEGTRPQEHGGTPTDLYRYQAMYQQVSQAWIPIAPAKGYCVDADTQPDPVVFQEAIDVDPVNGQVTRGVAAMNVVTMSCRKGAIATVFSWGYRYRGTSAETFYFDAGIHMKRASYCADAEAYTESGVKIWISDDQYVNDGGPVPVEAWWTPEGATCLSTLRRPRIAAAHGFTHSCPARTPPNLPPCPPVPSSLPALSLIDGPGIP